MRFLHNAWAPVRLSRLFGAMKKKEKKEKTELKKTKTTNKSLQVSLKLKMARLIQANNWGVKFSDCTSFEGIFSSQTSLKE